MKKLLIVLIAITASFTGVAQKAKANAKDSAGTIISTYSCPMHPGVTSHSPGKCTKCGMDLTLSGKEVLKREIVKIYSCPSHADLTSNKPGKCPTCGTNLALSKKEIMKREVVELYTCSMHPDVITDKTGKCPKCGMALVEKKAGH